MAMLSRMLEACLLIGMGAFMLVLAQSEMYWQFLNPKYSWLTFTAGALIVLIAYSLLFDVRRKRRVSEMLGVVVFLCLAGTALQTSQSFDELAPKGLSNVGEQQQSAPTMELGGVEYTKINVMELLAGEIQGWVQEGGAYAVQGAVVRTPELDQAGFIGVGRLLIQCCFADAIGALLLVKVEDPESYVANQWVQAVGVLKAGTLPPGDYIPMPGALSAMRGEKYFLEGVDVKTAPVEGTPFVFEVRSAPPYAY